MRARIFLPVGLVFAAACGAPEQSFVGELEAPVVYGQDDRIEVYAHPDPDLQGIATESVVALIPTARVQPLPEGDFGILASSLKDQRDLCDDEPFANQPVAASCSGVLIADDLVLTAGHCVGPSRPCTSFTYVFDYHLAAPNTLAAMDEDDVYTCSRIVLDADSPLGQNTPDFAIIELDRPVTGAHSPAWVRPVSPLLEGAPLSMIGSGSGLPVKIDSGAVIADPRTEQGDYFVVNLDAFQGHSGSPTFDEESRLAGILIGGRVPDYVYAPGEDCARANVFDDSMAGEIVHNIAPIVASLCESGEGPDELCAPDACEGEPCGAPSTPSEIDDRPNVPLDPTGDAPGCRVAPESGRPHALFFMLFAWVAARRVRRKAV